MSFIRSHGIGEVFVNPINESVCKANSSFFDNKKKYHFLN